MSIGASWTQIEASLSGACCRARRGWLPKDVVRKPPFEKWKAEKRRGLSAVDSRPQWAP
jgi:hypothetical protein